MAIKISGTTVIDNSQNITNAGIVTATSFTGDGSQLTNLPGGGGNTLEAVASGTLADGSKVIVNTDGTVSVVNQTETTGAGFGSPTIFSSSGSTWSVGPASTAYDSSTGKVVIAYADGGTTRGKAIVGTVSGTSITFGSPSIFLTQYLDQNASVAFVGSGKFVVTYRNSSGSYNGRVRVGTISGDSISFGSQLTFSAAEVGGQGVTYDSANDRIVIAYRDGGNSDHGRAVVGQVSGTSITFGTPSTFNSASTHYIQAIYDSDNGKVVITYRDDGNSDLGTAVVGTVNSSNNTISFGSDTAFGSGGQSNYIAATYTTNGKIVVVYQDRGNSVNYSAGTAAVGTVSGNSISFGTPVVFDTNEVNFNSVTYNPASGKVLISYQDQGNSNYGEAIEGTISGTSISFGTSSVYARNGAAVFTSAVYDSANQKVVIAYVDQGNSTQGTAIVFGHAGFPVPSAGTPVVYNSSGSTPYSSAVHDPTNNKVVIAYRDNANSNYGTAIVGTVSGTSISFGSPTVFESARSDYISTTYDSTNNKVVIAYHDDGNSSYGTAVVGTVSGTSISFGSPVVFESSNVARTSVAFDSTNNKVVIAYRNDGNSSYGRAVVGTVSGTSISFGSPVVFESGITNFPSIAFDSTNNKVVIAYIDDGNNSYGKAVVGTVSGTSISFGSPVTFASATTNGPSIAYDTANQKVVIAYANQANSYRGTAIVGTVSGTSISYGSPTLFEGGSTAYISTVYDSTNNKIIIAYQDTGNSSYGTAVVGTVSGTSVSFGSPTIFESASTAFISAEFDSSNQKVVIAYMDSGNSSYGTAVTFSPRTISQNLTAENFIGISDGAYSDGQTATIQLTGAVDDAQSSLTPGQAYYVQNDGTLSTSADSPSVFAGTALSSTKLIVRG